VCEVLNMAAFVLTAASVTATHIARAERVKTRSAVHRD
jgi:hypothetical protein